MKKIILLSAIALFLSTTIGCEKDEEKSKYPPCMQEQIDAYMANNPTPPTNPASIKKYSCDGKIVYVYEMPHIIDAGFTVVDKDCNIICGSNGLTGKSNCKFELKYIETVWKDNRKK